MPLASRERICPTYSTMNVELKLRMLFNWKKDMTTASTLCCSEQFCQPLFHVIYKGKAAKVC